jgi:tetratricopeptide (TPR) repeat protein
MGMKRSYLVIILALFFLGMVGFTPERGSDFAEYRRLPMKTRVERMQKSGEDLFLRRRYEDAIKVFDTVLALRSNDLKARLWRTKAEQELVKERNDAEKQALYEKYNGHLIPEDRIYGNWNWDPSIGHFEVRYSEPKPYVRPVRKLRPYATDADLNKAVKKAGSGKLEDLFEVAMLYWSRKDRDNALKYFHQAYGVSPEVLMLDDEMMLITIINEIEEKSEKGSASAQDLYELGRLQLIQGDRAMGISSLVEAASLDKKIAGAVDRIISDFIESPQLELVTSMPEYYAFRQGYVYEAKGDYLYIYLCLQPRNHEQVVSLDYHFPLEIIEEITPESKDCVFAYVKETEDKAVRFWYVLPRKSVVEGYYEIKAKVKLKRDKAENFELSNFALSEIHDNWSFVIGKDVNFASIPNGENEYQERGLRVSGHHLPLYSGRGPYIIFADFTEALDGAVDVWGMMEPKPYELRSYEEAAAEGGAEGIAEAGYEGVGAEAGYEGYVEEGAPGAEQPAGYGAGVGNVDIGDMDIGL